MPAAPLVVTALVALSTLLGTLELAFGTVLDPWPATVACAGMALLTIVAVSGTLLARGRWAAPTDAAIAVTWIGVAVASPLDAIAVAVLLVATAALTASMGPWLRGWVRRLPRADGPPPAAVILLLALLATGPVAAFAAPRGLPIAAAVLAAASPLIALALARIAPGALLAVRVVWPALCIAAAVAIGLPGGAAVVAIGAVVTAMAWRRDLALAIAPAIPQRTETYAIPPELVPPEILDAAGLDEHGYPKERS